MKMTRIVKREGSKYPVVENLVIESVAAEGKAMGRVDDMVVFVPFVVPGDVVDVQINRRKSRFMEGFVVRYREYSPMRVEAKCEHFGVCGGCRWQHLPYAEQLKFKKQQVEDQLKRIGKLQLPEIRETKPSAKEYFYRNKLEFTFSPKRWVPRKEIEMGVEIDSPEALGFHVPKMFDKVLDVKKCWLQPDPSNQIRLYIKRICVENDIPFYDVTRNEGMMRNVVIRTSSTKDLMVIVVFGMNDSEHIELVMSSLKREFPQITSLMYIINEKLNDSILDQELVLYHGVNHIFEEMEGLRFKIGGKSFYQTNSEQAYELYKVARDFAELKPTDVVYDLYTGTGTIANFIARHCSKVVGIEYVREAIEDAKVNAKMNGIENCSFHSGDMKRVLNGEFIKKNGAPNVIILDPPRAGVDQKVIETILEAGPERIVYVSCNPASQARDVALMEQWYEVVEVQPVDMFPHTHHVENVMKLVRRG